MNSRLRSARGDRAKQRLVAEQVAALRALANSGTPVGVYVPNRFKRFVPGTDQVWLVFLRFAAAGHSVVLGLDETPDGVWSAVQSRMRHGEIDVSTEWGAYEFATTLNAYSPWWLASFTWRPVVRRGGPGRETWGLLVEHHS